MEFDRRRLIKGLALGAAALVAGTREAQGQSIFHPQIREAIDVLYGRGFYDLLRIDLVPQKTIIQLYRALPDMYKYPDQVRGQMRWVKKFSEGVYMGLPGGSPDRQIRAVLPEGRNPIILTKLGQRYSGSLNIKQEWLFLNVAENESIIFENADGSYRITADPGPISLLVNNYDNPGGVENPIPWLKLIYPPDGFASDRYLPTPAPTRTPDSRNTLPTPAPTRTPDSRRTPSPTPFICTTESADIWGNGGKKDRVVNILDFSKLASEFGKTRSVADINRDGVVNIMDFSCLRSHFNKRY